MVDANWLRDRTLLEFLPSEPLDHLAASIEERTARANRRLVLEDTPVEGLYVLLEGRLESYRTSQIGAAWSRSLLPSAIVHLQELLGARPAQHTVVTLSDCKLGFVSTADFQHWLHQFPEVSPLFDRHLVRELAEVTAELLYERDRQAALRPYLIPKAERGIVGSSRYAVRLRAQVREAARDRQAALIFGEPGLEKDNVAALIHFSSSARRQPLVQIDCSRVQASGADLFGRAGGKPGLLAWVGTGTLVLNNVEDLPPELVPNVAELLRTGTYTPVRYLETVDTQPRPCRAQIVLVSERVMPELERAIAHAIKVPPLRVRKTDIKAYADYFISLYCRSRRIPKPQVAPEALRRLQSYDFPGNLRELQSLVERAIAQSEDSLQLNEEVFWPARSKRKRFRLNLLNVYPQLRAFLRTSWWPDRINYWIVAPSFALVVFLLFWGPQDRVHNVGLNLFWAWWWPVVLVLFPFLGRIWCAVCPFMIYGEIAQKVSLWLFPRQLKKWPRETMERWGGWFVVVLFAAIFLWEELWDLSDTAYLSAYLLLLITAGAVIGSLLFERRIWCRYLCPIGGMNGLYAKLSAIELRAQQGTCSAECTTYQCYKGGPEKGEGMETDGCPLYSHPAQLQDNKDCVLCMTCLKACPHRSVELNLRPPGIELWTTHTPRPSEVALLLLLFGGIVLHRLPEIQLLLNLNWHLERFGTHSIASLVALAVPASVLALCHGIYKLLGRGKARSLQHLAYGYLPLVLGGTLAHYIRLGLNEAGQIIPVTYATFGLSGQGLPIVVGHPAVQAFLEGVTLVVAWLLSIVVLQNIARQSIARLLPHVFCSALLTAGLWVVILGH